MSTFGKRTILASFAAAMVVFALAPQAVAADGPSDTILVGATVPIGCTFTTTSDTVDFGIYDPVAANATSAITRTYTAHYLCTARDTTYTFAFSGLNQTGGQCRMRGAVTADYLNYNVKDSANRNFPCNDVAATPANAPAGAGATALTYGFIFTLPAGQNTVTTGSYTDTLTATIAE